MLGGFGVGKTSLVSRYVHSIFTDKYHTTVGVKIDKKIVAVDGQDVTLMLWDMAGEDDSAPVKLNQVRDASGYLLVVDGCRQKTLEVARDIQRRVAGELGPLPFLLLANKADMRQDWEIPDAEWERLKEDDWTVLETSAKSGLHVEAAFQTLTSRILSAHEQAVAEDE